MRPITRLPIEETLRAMDDMVRSGKVRYIACSNFRAWRLCEALWTSERHNLERFACVQPLYNIVNRDPEVELFPLCREHGLGVVCYSPLARGVLTGKYLPGAEHPTDSRAARGDVRMQQAELREASFHVAQSLKEYCDSRNQSLSQFALAWCLANPNLTSVIIGPRTMEHFDDNLGCLDIEVTPEDEAFVDGSGASRGTFREGLPGRALSDYRSSVQRVKIRSGCLTRGSWYPVGWGPVQVKSGEPRQREDRRVPVQFKGWVR